MKPTTYKVEYLPVNNGVWIEEEELEEGFWKPNGAIYNVVDKNNFIDCNYGKIYTLEDLKRGVEVSNVMGKRYRWKQIYKFKKSSPN